MASLKQQAYKGVFWTVLEKISDRGLQFIVGIILARILSPAEFGLVGMVIVFIAISVVFVDSGFGIALINKKQTTKEEESSVFWLNLVISVIFFIVLYFTAPYIAIFYKEPILKNITRVLGINLIIQAFGAIHLNLLTKKLDFRTQFKLTFTSKLVSGGVGIFAALSGYGVWALVIQRLVQAAWGSVWLWIYHNWRPDFKFSFAAIKPLWRYGSNVLFARLTTTFFDNIYSLVIGKGFSANALGFYRRAINFQNMPLSLLTTTIGKISFPLYSNVKDEKAKFVHMMGKSLVLMSFASFPIFAAMMIMAEPLVILLIKDKWLPAVPYLRWLCVVGMLSPWHLMNVQSIVAYGRSDLNFRLSLLKNTLRLINLIVMMQYSVLHIVIGEVVVSFLALFINTYYTYKLFNYGLVKQINNIKKIIFSTVIISLVTIIPALFPDLNTLTAFLLHLSFFLVTYFITAMIFNRDIVFEIKEQLGKINEF
jgi:teichuronic acid exporter